VYKQVSIQTKEIDMNEISRIGKLDGVYTNKKKGMKDKSKSWFFSDDYKMFPSSQSRLHSNNSRSKYTTD
jgi:hypothetical protein